MKVADILVEVSADGEESEGHVTAKTFMDVMRSVKWPGAKFFTAGQARNNKTSRVIPVGVEVLQDFDKAPQYINQVNAALMKAFPNLQYRIEDWQYNGQGYDRDMYYWYLKVDVQGPARARLDFINFCKALGKQYTKAGQPVGVWTENRKDGAHIQIRPKNFGVDMTDVDVFVEEVIEKFGEHIEVQPNTYYTEIIYR